MLRAVRWIWIVLTFACGPEHQRSEPTAASVSASGSVKAPAAKPAPARAAELPAGRDAEAAKLVKAGSACKVENDNVESGCEERRAAGEYAVSQRRSKEVAATCAELVRDPSIAVKRVAASCLERLDADATTLVLGHVLDSIEAETNTRVKEHLARSMRTAEAPEAKLEDRVIAMIDKLVATKEELAAGSLLETLVPRAVTGKQPSKAATDAVLRALARKQGGLFYRATDLARLLADKPAACEALATAATPADDTDWPLALASINEMHPVCAAQAAGLLEKILVDDKWIVARPEELTKLAELELTPALRRQAVAALTRARKSAGDFKQSLLDLAIAAFGKPAKK